ncbi:MAG: hypothetical protein R3C49_19560 [Planctomycetaceae bacterium]
MKIIPFQTLKLSFWRGVDGFITVTATQDEVAEVDESIVIDIFSVSNATEDGSQQQQ